MTDLSVITKAAVIGAGSMGSGIAAHLANAGVEVHLLDISKENAEKGIERQLKHHGFQVPEAAQRVTAGSISEDAERLADAEWIVEAVFEDLDVKHETFRTIAENRAPGTPVSSNTSTIPLAKLTEGLDEEFTRDFAIIHFFNPPRIMRLVELVRGENTSEETATTLTRICEQQLGKVVIECRDTPGFIANRVGNFWMAVGADLALRQGLDPETADAAFGRPFGVPRTGIFGLFDYVGLQLVRPIWGSLLGALPASDAYHQYDITQRSEFAELLEKGYQGRSTGSGFYRGRDETYCFEGHDYRPRRKPGDPALAERDPQALMSQDTPAGRYARDVYLTTLRYCCETAPEIADSVESIDDAMALGYGWKQGPFALAERIGLEWLAEQYGSDAPALLTAAVKAGGFYPDGKVLATDGTVVPRREREGVVTVAELVRDAEEIFANDGAVVNLLPNGVAVVSLTTPMNSCSPAVLDAFQWVADAQDKGVKAVVVANDEARAFSAGANLSVLAELAAKADEKAIYELLRKGAESLWALRQAPFPVVGAVRGVALGGGLELLLHCDAVVAHAESRVGFPEPNVGLYPAWGGTVRGLERYVDAGVADPHRKIFDLIASARPVPILRSGFLREGDRVVQSPDHVVAQALELAESLVEGYEPPAARELPLTEETLTIEGGTETDNAIANAVARIYQGTGTLDAYEMGLRETEYCPPVLARPENAARAEHMARTRKPLRN